jgi:hypothetical protein
VGMVQIHRKIAMMDVLISDVPPTYGMMLSRHWRRTFVGRNIQFYLSYATILIFGEETCCLYKDPKMTYVISDLENPTKFPSYNIGYIGKLILIHEPPIVDNCLPLMCEGEKSNPFGLWTLDLYGAYNT